MRGRSAVGLVSLVATLLTSCDPYAERPNNALGISLSTDGRLIQIQYVLCPGQAVKFVELVNTREDPVVGDEGDPVLWKVTSSNGSETKLFTVGETPPGFVEDVPFTGELPANARLGVLVETTKIQAVADFLLSDLSSTRVYSRGKTLSQSEFADQAMNAGCRPSPGFGG